MEDLQRIPRTANYLPLLLTSLFLLACGCRARASNNGSLTASPDKIVVVKSTHTLTLIKDGRILKTYNVALSREPGAKQREGDHKVPEGEYVVDSKNVHSRFDRALHISYPNSADRERARKLGVEPGGDVEIHGLNWKYAWLGSLQRRVDWTDGCVALTNSEIEQIWPLVRVGTTVDIRP